jgi:transcriptional regulator
MYIPSANREDDPAELRSFMRAHPLCALVSMSRQGLVATHLPVVLHESESGFGTLRGHVARGNTQWRELDPRVEALAIFTGPQHFISASWYPGKKTHGKEVPTWNYVAIHAYGQLRAVDDPEWILEHVKCLSEQQEVIAEVPWKVSDAPAAFIDKMTRAIVGLELQISRVEGSWKASQNRREDEALAVMAGLDQVGTAESVAMRDLIKERRPNSSLATSQDE